MQREIRVPTHTPQLAQHRATQVRYGAFGRLSWAWSERARCLLMRDARGLLLASAHGWFLLEGCNGLEGLAASATRGDAGLVRGEKRPSRET
jgi:hypothetical protein